MKTLIKQVEKSWDSFSESEKEMWFQGIEEIEQKLVRLSSAQQVEFYKGGETKNPEVYGLILEFKEFRERTMKIIECGVEDL